MIISGWIQIRYFTFLYKLQTDTFDFNTAAEILKERYEDKEENRPVPK